jgi:hypothetical protein
MFGMTGLATSFLSGGMEITIQCVAIFVFLHMFGMTGLTTSFLSGGMEITIHAVNLKTRPDWSFVGLHFLYYVV